MKRDIHAPMNRARELYVKACTQAERNAVSVAEQRLKECTPRAREHAQTYQVAQRWHDDAAKALGKAEQVAAEYFESEITSAYDKREDA